MKIMKTMEKCNPNALIFMCFMVFMVVYAFIDPDD